MTVTRQCLARHIPDPGTLAREAAAWAALRSAAQIGASWLFTATGVRTNLVHLYPIIELDGRQETDDEPDLKNMLNTRKRTRCDQAILRLSPFGGCIVAGDEP